LTFHVNKFRIIRGFLPSIFHASFQPFMNQFTPSRADLVCAGKVSLARRGSCPKDRHEGQATLMQIHLWELMSSHAQCRRRFQRATLVSEPLDGQTNAIGKGRSLVVHDE
jgi:hypothetical protein